MNPEEFVTAYEAALGTQDWPHVAPLIHEDACVTFSSGSVHKGKSAIKTAYEGNFAAIKGEEYAMKDLHWLRKGPDTAVYLFNFRWSGWIDGNLASGGGRGTTVLIKNGDAWQLLAEHLGPSPSLE